MKGKKTDLACASCAVARSLGIIGDWWSLLIIRDALGGTQRFSEFQKNIGLAKNILSTRLHKLVEAGIFSIEQDATSPHVRRYVLTDRGKKLTVVILAIWQWGEENCFKPGELRHGIADEATGRMLAKLEIKTVDGCRIDPTELKMLVKLKSCAGTAQAKPRLPRVRG